MKNKNETENQVNDNLKMEDLPYTIYNYCDYRCDKCEYVNRCPVFKEKSRIRIDGRPWTEVLDENLKNTSDLLKAIMDEEDISFMPDSDEYELSYQKMRDEVTTKLPCLLAKQYMEEVMDFLKSYSPGFLVFSRLDDAASDLASYSTILPVKIQRTLMSVYHFVVEEEEFDLMDAFLTARVVYKALNKSIAAIDMMRDVLVDEQSELNALEDLVHRIRSSYWHEFPFEIFFALILAKQKKKP